jgi:hypothetical protein
MFDSKTVSVEFRVANKAIRRCPSVVSRRALHALLNHRQERTRGPADDRDPKPHVVP